MYMKNQLFQKVGIKCKDGSMLHLLSRQEVDLSKFELDEKQLKSMLETGFVRLSEKSTKSTKSMNTTETAKPQKIEASTTKTSAEKETEGSKSSSKHK